MKCKHKLQHHSDRHFYIIELWLEAFSFNWLFSAGQWITRGQFNLIISVFSIFILFFSIYQIQVNALLLGLKWSAINHSSLEANISMQEPRETINKKSWKLEGNDLLLVTLHHCVFLDVHESFHQCCSQILSSSVWLMLVQAIMSKCCSQQWQLSPVFAVSIVQSYLSLQKCTLHCIIPSLFASRRIRRREKLTQHSVSALSWTE